jgi:UDP-N-acetylmuramate dehydrogenase
MNFEKIVQSLQKIDGITIRTQEPLHRHTPLRVGGPAKVWALVANENSLKRTILVAKRNRVRWKIHWPFDDWLVKDSGFNGIIIRLIGEFEQTYSHEGTVVAHSAVLWSKLPSIAPWLEEFRRWPGTVGGLFQKNEANCLRGFPLRIHCLIDQEIETIEVSKRQKAQLPEDSIPLRIEIAGKRKARDLFPSRGGTLFKLPKGGAVHSLVHEYGLCGIRLRNWKLSTESPGLIIHTGRGNCSDAILLTKALQERIQKIHGTKWELNIPIIGTRRGKK